MKKNNSNIKHIKIQKNIYLQHYHTSPVIITRKKCPKTKKFYQKFFNLNDYYYDEAIHYARKDLERINELIKLNMPLHS